MDLAFAPIILACCSLIGIGLMVGFMCLPEDKQVKDTKGPDQIDVSAHESKSKSDIKFTKRREQLERRFSQSSCDEISKLAEIQTRQESLEKLKFFIDYSKFHVGLYSAIAVFLVTGIMGKDTFIERTPGLMSCALITVGCYVVAGFIGGLILSNAIHNVDIDEFKRKSMRIGKAIYIGTFWPWLLAQYLFFWGGTLLFVGGLIYYKW